MLDLDARTNVTSAFVGTNETRTSTSFGDLTTVGPAITIVTGTTAAIQFGAALGNSTVNDGAVMSFQVSGATTIAVATITGLANLAHISNPANAGHEGSAAIVVSGLTPGSNTFTPKYRADIGGTAFFLRRWIIGQPANKLS